MDRQPEKSLPVYERGRNIGYISYAELMEFLNHEEAGSNIYVQKLNFDLGSALIRMRDIKSNIRKKFQTRILSVAVMFIVLSIGLLFFRSAYYTDGDRRNLLYTESEMQEHIVKVPRGRQSRLKLPDGTEVWLNAGSTISYPVRFAEKQRIVFLTGEAYFEVAKLTVPASDGVPVPFIVKTEKQEIEVLGTHFNVSAYPDDRSTRTVLLEGSVKVKPAGRGSDALILKPNQQSILTDTHIDVTAVDSEDATAWKKGDFSFRKERLDHIMRVLTRWYDIEVVFENEQVAEVEFGGSISKSSTLKKVLGLLELTGGAHFRIEGKRVFVTGY